MCGIAGFTWEDKSLIRKMTRAIQHRGPDDEGFYIDKDISLGHRRLSILDLSEKGHQPMFTEDDNYVIIFNGEIYNYPQLKEQLIKLRYRFSSNSDTEAILHGYQEYGVKVLQHLDGMFTFALWDRRKKELVLARDRLGKKPLYYYKNENGIAFASEIKALLEDTELDRGIDMQSISNFLTLRFSSGNTTIFSAVRKLEPGTAILFSQGRIKRHSYWKLPVLSETQKPSRKEVDSLIADSVKKRLLADVPIGVFLSGGLDSSTIVSYMSRFTDNIQTFSVGFSDGSDESPYAEKVARAYNTNHTSIMLDRDILGILPQVVWHLDEPLADPASLPTYLLCKEVSKKVKVALSGEGGDEVFGGYDSFNKIPALRRIARTPSFLSKGVVSPALSASSAILRYPYKQMSNLAAEIAAHPKDLVENTKRLFYFPFNRADKRNLFVAGVVKKINPATAVDSLINSEKNIENQVIQFYFKEWLPNDLLMKVDKTSMAHGLEVRAPFLDVKLVEYYSKIGLEYKYNRRLFREVVKDLLPKTILRRSKKGFTLPLSSWMQRKEFVQRIKPHIEDLKSRHIIKVTEIDKIMKNTGAFRNDHRLWVLLNLELWYKEYIDGQNPRKIKI